MPLQLPNLDDRTFADLVEEGISLIPRYAPEWTNHNPSDPGITLIELLAYFTEMLIYRLNQVSRESKVRFLQLLGGPESDPEQWLHASVRKIEEEIEAKVLKLRQPQRAVTCQDFEHLARQAMEEESEERRVVRARCVARKNLEADPGSWELDRPGHVSVVVLPDPRMDPLDLASWLGKIRTYLQPKCLLTTRLHVVEPHYLWVSFRIVVRLRPGASFDNVQEAMVDELERYFSPFPGGVPLQEGWPFGRNIHFSEISNVLDRVQGVDRIEEVRLLHLSFREESVLLDRSAVGIQIGIRSTVGVDSRLGVEPALGEDRLIRSDAGDLIAVALRPYELVKIVIRKEDIWRSTPAHLPMRPHPAIVGSYKANDSIELD